MSEIEKSATKFIEEHIKTLPLQVKLSGITEAEKTEAASLCINFAERSVREFVKRINNPLMVDEDFDVAASDVFREMFGKRI